MASVTASNIEIEIGKLIGAVAALSDSHKDASESRRRMHEELQALTLEIHTLRTEVKGLNERLDAIEPGVKDYLGMQQQVAGAGKLGRALWWLGGVLLAAASSVAAMWCQMTGRPPP